MKKTLAMLLAALMLTGTTTAAFAADKAPVALNEEINLTADGEQLQGPMSFVGGSLSDCFDGDPATYADYAVDGGEDYWVGLKLPAPATLTWVQMWAPDYNGDGVVERVHCLYGTIIEGSHDGENWEFIMEFGDIYTEYEEYAWDMEDGIADYFDEIPYDGETDFDDDATDPVAYQYYRFWNDTKGIAIWGDIQIWGYYEEIDYIAGDINMDTEVDINDAMYLFQHSMLPDLFTIEYPGNVDFEADGVTDINDAIYLFQHTLLPDLYPIE